MKSLITFSGIIVLVVFSLCLLLSVEQVTGRKSMRKLKYCKADVVLECAIEPNAVFTSTENGSGIVNSQEDMEQFCFNQVDYVPICVKQWLARCGNPAYQEVVFKLFFQPMRERMLEFCDPKKHIRNEFLKYSDCLIHQVKLSPSYRKQCIRPLQAASEWIHNRAVAQRTPDALKVIRATCCAYNRWEDCILSHLTERCSKPSAVVFPYLIHHGSLDMVRYFCSSLKYNHKDPTQCDPAEFSAPEDFVPRGLKSTSVMSYIFSYSCPNVGWAVIPERDF